MDEFSSTHYNFVKNPKQSNLQRTIDKAVVRNDTGNLIVRQCKPQLHEKRVQTRSTQEFNGKTVGDILSRLQENKRLYKMIMDKD